jgi:photosystem II stability/assembly factor-like uncharacterized protein
MTQDGMGSAYRPGRWLLFALAALALVALALAAIRTVGAGPSALATPPAASSATGPVPNETYDWKPVAIGGGGFITGLSTDAAGKTWVGRADVYGAYLWDAAGHRWRQLVTEQAMPAMFHYQNAFNQGVYEIVVAPNDPNRLYMATKGRMFRSDDRGVHWQEPDSGAPFPLTFDPNSEFRLYGPFMAVDPGNADLVFLGTPGDGLWRSADGGAHWAPVGSVPKNIDLRPDAGVQAPGTLVWFGPQHRVYAAAAGQGVFVSGDAGEHFAALVPSSAPQPKTVMRATFTADGKLIAVDQEAKKVWLFDKGAWTDLTAGGALSPEAYQAVAADPRGGAIFLTDQGGKSWCSADGAHTWSRLIRTSSVGPQDPPWLPQVGPLSFFAAGEMRFDPAVPGKLWLAGGSGPYVADVGSGCPWRLAWRSQVRGIEELVANDALQPPGGPPLFAGWDFGIHVKPDLDQFSTTWGPKPRQLISAQQLDWSPADPRFIVTNASDTRQCCSEDGDSVLAGYSTDGGQHWSKFASLPTPPGTKVDDPWRMAYGTIAVSAGSTDNIVWEPAGNRSPFYTLDRGRTWQRVTLPGEMLPNTGSFDGFWHNRKTLAADRVKPHTFYLVHTGEGANAALTGLWRTDDGGAAWRRVFSGLIAPDSQGSARLRAVPGHAGELFFTSNVGGGPDTRLRRSHDGGATWTALDGITQVDDVAFGKAASPGGYPTIFVSANIQGTYGIWRSVDDAASWQRIAAFPLGRLDQISVVEADKDVFGRVYIGFTGSGWIYGEPAPCSVRPLEQGADRECRSVETAIGLPPPGKH